jgi:hypothetical protein
MLYVKVGKARGFEFQLEICQNSFFNVKPLLLYIISCDIQSIQIWIDDLNIINFYIKNYFKHQYPYLICLVLYFYNHNWLSYNQK